MSKTWRVALYEYQRHVLKPSFILAVLSLPLTIALMIGLIWFATTFYGSEKSAIGYVDHAGVLTAPIPAPRRGSSPDEPSVSEPLPMLPFSSEEGARLALEGGEIQAYYVIAEDYVDSNRVELVYLEPPDSGVRQQFWDFMQINRLTDVPPETAQRAVAGSNLIVRWPGDGPAGGREFSQRTFVNQFLPLLVGVAFLFLLFMSSGYLMGAIAEEKGFRTIEILFTSLSPTQLMGGKIASVVGVSFTQLFAWISLSALLVWLGNNVLGSNLLQNLSLDVASIVPLIIVFFPAYLLFAACMTALGATFAEAQDAQGVMGIFIMLTMIPVWAFQLMSNNPDGPLPVGLTLFPFTALSTLSLRLTFTQVPVWQIVACATILTASAGCAVWFAGRAFRLGMLRYGQNLNLREILRAQSHNRDEHEQNATHRA